MYTDPTYIVLLSPVLLRLLKIMSSSVGWSLWPAFCPCQFFRDVMYFSESLCCCQQHQCHSTFFFFPVHSTCKKSNPVILNIFLPAHTLSEGHGWMGNACTVLLCVENSNSFDSTQSEVRTGTDSFTFIAVTQRTGWLLRVSAFLINKATPRRDKPWHFWGYT